MKTFLEHEALFKDEFRGLDVRGRDFPFETKKKVWQNSKIARHAGTRVVPFAVFHASIKNGTDRCRFFVGSLQASEAGCLS